MTRWLIVLLGCLALSGCGHTKTGTAEAAFEEAVAAVEAADAEKIESLLAPDFAGDYGREQVLAYAKQWFSRRPDIKITVLKHEKQENPQKPGQATFRSEVVVSSGKGLLPKRSSRVRVDTQWEYVDGRWLLRVAQWSRVR